MGIDKMNKDAMRWIAKADSTPPEAITGQESPVWTRVYSVPQPSEESCKELAEVLRRTGAKRLVVAHTVQAKGMGSACDGHVWRIDVGLSHYYGDAPIQVLEIDEKGARPLSASRVH